MKDARALVRACTYLPYNIAKAAPRTNTVSGGVVGGLTSRHNNRLRITAIGETLWRTHGKETALVAGRRAVRVDRAGDVVISEQARRNGHGKARAEHEGSENLGSNKHWKKLSKSRSIASTEERGGRSRTI